MKIVFTLEPRGPRAALGGLLVGLEARLEASVVRRPWEAVPQAQSVRDTGGVSTQPLELRLQREPRCPSRPPKLAGWVVLGPQEAGFWLTSTLPFTNLLWNMG